MFTNESGTGGFNPHNFRERAFRMIATKALGRGRRFTPHGLRHTFASLHLARGTNLLWIQAMGGWESKKMLLDVYGHYMPKETSGFAVALDDGAKRSRETVKRTRRTRRPAAGSVLVRGPLPSVVGRRVRS